LGGIDVKSLWANPRRAYRFCIALGVALALPALAAPFAIDDIFHLASLEGAAPVPLRWWELFTFFPSDAGRRAMLVGSGAMPWWSSPDLTVVFFRPLSSALVALDHAWFGRNPVGWHAHCLLWWAALLAGAGLLYRRLLPAATAALALLLFAIDDSHWLPIVWSAARNALVAMVPALFGLIAHVRWREAGWRAGAVLAVLGFGLGLAGGEVAVGDHRIAIAGVFSRWRRMWPCSRCTRWFARWLVRRSPDRKATSIQAVIRSSLLNSPWGVFRR
jgi:hypothetical protein